MNRKVFAAPALLLALAALGWAQEQVKPQEITPIPVGGKPQAPAVDNKGRIELSLTTWDFGTKWAGDPAEQVVALKNVGEGPLTIEKVQSSCGCTVARPNNAPNWNGLVLKPGESETMTLSYNTKKLKEKVSQSVTVFSDDRTQPRATITVQGSIKQAFEMTPAPRIVFTGLAKDSEETKEIMLTSALDEPIELKLADSSTDTQGFTLKLEPVEAGKKYKLIATTKPPLKAGSNAIVAQLETNNDRFKSLTVPVSAYIAPRVQVSPTTLYVPRNSSKAVQRFVRVRYTTQQPLAVTSVESGHESVKASLLPATPTPAQQAIANHTIRVDLPPASEFPAEGTTITIKTDDKSEEYKEFKVEVRLQPERQTAREMRTVPAKLNPTALQGPPAPPPAAGEKAEGEKEQSEKDKKD